MKDAIKLGRWLKAHAETLTAEVQYAGEHARLELMARGQPAFQNIEALRRMGERDLRAFARALERQ